MYNEEEIAKDIAYLPMWIHTRMVEGDVPYSYTSIGPVGTNIGLFIFNGHAGHGQYLMELMQKMIDNPSEYFDENKQLDPETQALLDAAQKQIERMRKE